MHCCVGNIYAFNLSVCESATTVNLVYFVFTMCNVLNGSKICIRSVSFLRIDPSKDYSEENTIIGKRISFYRNKIIFFLLVPRAQFLAIEVSRNRLGYNSIHNSQP